MKELIKEHKEVSFFIVFLIGVLTLLGFRLMPLFTESDEESVSESGQKNQEATVEPEELPEHFADLDETVIEEMNENENSFYNSGTFENAQKEKLKQKEVEKIDEVRGQFDESIGNMSVDDIKKAPENDHYKISVMYEDGDYKHTHDSVDGLTVSLSDLVIYEIEFLSEDIASFYDVAVGTVYTGVAYDIERESEGLELEFLISRTSINDNHDNHYKYDGIMSEVTPQMTGAKGKDKSTVSYIHEGSTGNEVASLLLKLPQVYDSITDEAVMNETQVKYMRKE